MNTNKNVIKILDQSLINKIAAGEVVERPASVVKELVENSIDAGATEISIEIEEGGLSLIKVTDNGCGMDEENLKSCVLRHATSKISSLADLNNIHTLGFRGEALAAISAVSQFSITTREHDAIGAIKFVDSNITKSAGQAGTSVEVRGLFHSVPARKKFLKSTQTEFRHIADIFTNQALLYPSISWKLVNNGKVFAQYPRVEAWKERVVAVLGKDVKDDLLEVNHARASFKVNGFIIHPHAASKARKNQYLFVNNRVVSDYMIAKAVKEGYSHHLPYDRYPSFVLKIEIAPDLVDVNVHPRKSEVKFADSSSVYREVLFAVKNTVEGQAQAKFDISSQSLPSFSKPSSASPFSEPNQSPSKQYKLNVEPKPSVYVNRASFQIQKPIDAQPKSDWQLVGQIHNSYILVQTTDGLLVIDQHAVAEKILYEKILANLQQPKKQPLLVPMVIEVTPKAYALILEQKEVLNRLGIELEDFGQNSVRLISIPQDLHLKNAKKFFLELLSDMQEEGVDRIKSVDDRQKRLLKYTACRGAIKFGDPLTETEMKELLNNIKKYNVIACVHGRPALWIISHLDFAKQFQRK